MIVLESLILPIQVKSSKMKRIRAALNFLLISVPLVLLMSSAGIAALSQGVNLEVPNLDPVCFYLLDDSVHSNDYQTTVTATNIFGTGNLEYSFSGESDSFVSWSNPRTVDLPPAGFLPIYFRLNTGANILTEADLTFNAFEAVYHGLDGYQNVVMNFDLASIQLATSTTNDNFASVPIPSAALLLGTGLIGIFRFRRRHLKG
jgi:hypothetical protein